MRHVDLEPGGCRNFLLTMEALHPDRVLILAPYGRDAELLMQALERGGIQCAVCSGVDHRIELLREGAATAVLADEALDSASIPALSAALRQQPSWSDLPVLLLTGAGDLTLGGSRRLKLLEPLGN